ncbi:MAG: hypothetical protein Q4A37_02605 [Candidatus Saccharibacteria bacterium]|nr:hypothetical protein [Candidatus Saccharibacteria bacterium]
MNIRRYSGEAVRSADDLALSVMKSAERPTARCDIYSISLSGADIDRANLGIDLADIPGHIAIKGGAARQMLEAVVLGRQVKKRPRDIDIVLYRDGVDWRGEYGWDKALSDWHHLEHQLSPRDAAYNSRGAEVLESVEEYMDEQDFTINQALLIPQADKWRLLATTQAIIDTANSIIRPTVYEYDQEKGYYLSNKLSLKAVRLLSEMQQDGREASLRSVDLRRGVYGEPRHDDFMQLLHLDKALSSGYDLACCYIENLHRFGIMHDSVVDEDDPIAAYQILLREHGGFAPSDEVQLLLDRRAEDAARREELAKQAIGNYDEDLFGLSYRLMMQVPSRYTDDYFNR